MDELNTWDMIKSVDHKDELHIVGDKIPAVIGAFKMALENPRGNPFKHDTDLDSTFQKLAHLKEHTSIKEKTFGKKSRDMEAFSPIMFDTLTSFFGYTPNTLDAPSRHFKTTDGLNLLTKVYNRPRTRQEEQVSANFKMCTEILFQIAPRILEHSLTQIQRQLQASSETHEDGSKKGKITTEEDEATLDGSGRIYEDEEDTSKFARDANEKRISMMTEHAMIFQGNGILPIDAPQDADSRRIALGTLLDYLGSVSCQTEFQNAIVEGMRLTQMNERMIDDEDVDRAFDYNRKKQEIRSNIMGTPYNPPPTNLTNQIAANNREKLTILKNMLTTDINIFSTNVATEGKVLFNTFNTPVSQAMIEEMDMSQFIEAERKEDARRPRLAKGGHIRPFKPQEPKKGFDNSGRELADF